VGEREEGRGSSRWRRSECAGRAARRSATRARSSRGSRRTSSARRVAQLEAVSHRAGGREQRGRGGGRTSTSGSSKTTRHPAPWSRMPWNTLSRIIWLSLRAPSAVSYALSSPGRKKGRARERGTHLISTSRTGCCTCSAMWAISTRWYGSMTRTRFCSRSVSYRAARCVRMIGSSESSAGARARRVRETNGTKGRARRETRGTHRPCARAGRAQSRRASAPRGPLRRP